MAQTQIISRPDVALLRRLSENRHGGVVLFLIEESDALLQFRISLRTSFARTNTTNADDECQKSEQQFERFERF